MVYRILVIGLLGALLGTLVLHDAMSRSPLRSQCPYGDDRKARDEPQGAFVERTFVNQAAVIVDIRRGTLISLLDRPAALWAAFGVEPRDRVLSVNGRRAEDLWSSSPMELAASYRGQPSVLDLELQRAGERVRMVVVIHEERSPSATQR